MLSASWTELLEQYTGVVVAEAPFPDRVPRSYTLGQVARRVAR